MAITKTAINRTVATTEAMVVSDATTTALNDDRSTGTPVERDATIVSATAVMDLDETQTTATAGTMPAGEGHNAKWQADTGAAGRRQKQPAKAEDFVGQRRWRS